jgi:dephospho-CoA kinase
MRFVDFLHEQKENHAVMAFGRMNPPTTGHAKLVDKVKEIAQKVGGSHHVVISHSQDAKKNPLSAKDKLKHAKRFFPNTNLSTSDSEHPTFLHHAAKLHQQGVTHLHMVAGSDRVDEYKKKLAQYNGTHEGALYNFKKITVHSAGERDPDAEGTEGMSASKMRGHASTGNFKEFRKGIPSHVPEHHAKELYNDVRKGMKLKEDIDNDFEELLVEGVHDKGIFKAVFLAGGPGSGKDYVLDNTLSGHGLTEINSDKALEFLMDKEKLDKTMPDDEEKQRNEVRNKAKSMTELRQRLALQGRNGLIINGTGDDYEKIKRIKEKLETLGYETSMVTVNTRDEVSQQRNVERGQRGGRTVPEKIRKQKWEAVQAARPKLAELFKDNYIEFDNSEDLRSSHPDVVKAKKDEMMSLFKGFQKFVSKPPKNESAKNWIASQLGQKDTLPTSEVQPEKMHPSEKDSNATQQARQLGLSYFGFGRWGKNGVVTHHVVHGNLVANEKEKRGQQIVQVPKTKTIDKVKNVNEEFEEFLNEAVTVTVQGDTPEEVAKTLKLLKSDDVEDVQEEQDGTAFSNSDSVTLLTLGQGVIKESTTPDLHHSKLMKDSKGKVRTFMLRRNAAKEAHTHNGVVHKIDKGYVVKIKENQDVTKTSELLKDEVTTSRITESRSSTRTDTDSRTSGESGRSITEEKSTRKKITIAEIYAKKKEQAINEIDYGIEPGMALNGYAKETISKKRKDGKVTVTELTGDETTMSIGDQKELELKRKGINLSTFKSRKFVG